jgi:hypothetical protein
MNKFYIVSILIMATSHFALSQDTAIRRASLSTSVTKLADEERRYDVQQSVAFMGIMTTAENGKHTSMRGFLLPQLGAPAAKPIADFDWIVYPNPFTTHVNIDFDAFVSGVMVVRIHDVSGQLVMEREVQAKQQQRISLGHLAQTEHLLTVEVMGKTFSQTLLNYSKPNEEKD